MERLAVALKRTARFSVFDILSTEDRGSFNQDPTRYFDGIPRSVVECGVLVLNESSLLEKARLTKRIVELWKCGEVTLETHVRGHVPIPSKPNRCTAVVSSSSYPPALPKLIRRNSIEITIHGIATAESFAVDLFWDCIARFSDITLPKDYYDELVEIAGQEADHFMSWVNRLEALNCPFGSLPMHDGLWKAAEQTSGTIASFSQ